MNTLPQSFRDRANRVLNLDDFGTVASIPVPVCQSLARPPVKRQYVLRMMVRAKDMVLRIPDELQWLAPTIQALVDHQRYEQLSNPYIYVTVRHGVVTSVTDDEWHVDGFSMRFPHVPEQNYICSHSNPTEFLLNRWQIPETFDPHKHNLHWFFQDRAEHEGVLLRGDPYVVYVVDPYCVHRRPSIEVGTVRTMWRVSFVPIEIEDDMCTPNPLMPEKIYGRTDIRKRLERWVE